MYLKTLTLRGFKSFASATRFEFEPGVTCVVGPNGSGKSNVVDALAWVMGEQGVKTLRGGKMEDVIFAGTSGRPPLGRAEVSLTIDNSDGALPIEFAEVTITRTLFRNGGSEYAINGTACRLLDIQDLLSDSGLGREMHVIVGQGQLDQILRATPLERRGFIEEAAGVLKHRKRKEKALRKLDNMQGNLLRLTDLIAELRRQLGPLGRQAQAARKAAVIAAQLRDSGLRLIADELNSQQNSRNDLARAFDFQQGNHRKLSEHASILRTRLIALEKTAEVLSPKAQRATDVLMELSGQREQLRTIMQVASERQRFLGAAPHIKAFRGSKETTEQLIQTRQTLEQGAVEVAAVTTRLADAERDRQQANETYTRLARKRDSIVKLKAEHREKVAQLGSKVASQRTRVESIGQNLERITADLSDAQARYTAATSAFDSATLVANEPVSATAELAGVSVHSSISELTARESELAEMVESASRELRSVRETHLEAERQSATHRARAKAQEDALEKALGSAKTLIEHDPGLVPFGQFLDVEPEHEKAVLAALSHLRHAVVAHTYEQAIHASQTAIELGLTSAVIAHPAASSNSLVDLMGLPNGAIIASDVVKTPSHNTTLRGVLERIVIAHPTQIAEILNKNQFVTVVTPHGEVHTSDWVVSQAQEDQIFAMKRDAENERKRYEELKVESAAHLSRVKSIEAGIQEAQSALKRVRSQLSEMLESQRVSEAASARASALRDAAAKEVQRLNQQRAETLARKSAEEEKLSTLATEYEDIVHKEHTVLPEDLAQGFEATGTTEASGAHDGYRAAHIEQDLANVAVVLEKVREVETLARLDLRSAQERQKNLENRVAGLERMVRQEEAAEIAAEEAAKQREVAAQKVGAVIVRAQQILAMLDRSIVRAGDERDNAIAQRDQYTTELTELRSQLSNRDAEIRELTQSVHEKELELAGASNRLEQLELKCIAEYGINAHDAIEQFGPHLDVPEYQLPQQKIALDEQLPTPDFQGLRAFDRNYLVTVHARAQKALGSLGKVNPLALEEFTALEERHKYLADQLADLKQSRSDLLKLVDDIDTRVQQVFAAAFEDTAAQFGEVFPRLFPGGEGRMFLTEPDDLLNTGIEIEARPAGKKVKRLSLLSGGERSLTAIAMLVSIFKARPSPFYVMDEVEAALDDVNLGRLLGVFRELQEESQLIVITHQKRTMEIADALYGVTMQGDGVSAVLSQRMEKAM